MTKGFNGSILAVDETPTNGLVEMTVLVPETALDDIKEFIDNDIYVRMTPVKE